MNGYDVKYDVIVCGGGTSGVCAAISAARNGANTLLIERSGILGGQTTLSGPPGFAFARLFNAYNQQETRGLVEEIHARMRKEGHALPHNQMKHRIPAAYTFSYVDPDPWLINTYFELCEESGVVLLLDTMVVDVLKDGDTVTGVVVEAVDGRHEIAGQIVIDCTGEGYVAADAGCEMECVDREIMQPHTICFTVDGVDWDELMTYINRHPDQFTTGQLLNPYTNITEEDVYEAYRLAMKPTDLGEIMGFFEIRDNALKNGDWHTCSGVGFFLQPKEGGKILAHMQHSTQVDHCLPTDAWDVTRCHIECRKQLKIAWRCFKNYVPGFKDAYIVKSGTELRFREGPRIVGDYRIIRDDVVNTARFYDAIGMSSFPCGAYHTTNINTLSVIGNQEIIKEKGRPDGSYQIPYRVMVPKKIENLLASGKICSSDRPAYLRYVQQTMVTGQAAGAAAALCIKKGITPRQMESEENIAELQKLLISQDAVIFDEQLGEREYFY